MERSQMEQQLSQILETDDRAERSTMLDEVRTETNALYERIDELSDQVSNLQERNGSLVEANSKLFMRLGVENKPETKNESKGLDISKMLKD